LYANLLTGGAVMVVLKEYRQKSGSNKTNVITFRIDKYKFDILVMLASAKGKTPHQLVRDIVESYLRAKGYIA
jgi:hypothetical protein